MAGFRKAKPQQAAIKLGLYGPPGSGKTMTALLIAEGLAKLTGKRIAYIDTERGTDFYCQSVKTRAIHPAAFDFDALYTRSITEVISAIRGLDDATHSVIVIDSITHVWEAAIAAYDGRMTSIGTIPIQAWHKLKKPYKTIMSLLLSSKAHMIIAGRQKTVFATDEETEELKAVGLAMRAEGETPYEPHILLRMEAVRPKHTGEIADIVAYAEKDRTGVLAGRAFLNPTFDTLIKPLLGLLGETQGAIDSGEETTVKDAEALAAEEEQRDKKSKELLREYKAKIDLTKTAKELAAIGKALTTKVKAEILPADLSQLREAYKERELALGKVAAPAEMTFAQVADAIGKADTADVLQMARDLIPAVEDIAQQGELMMMADDRAKALA